MMKKLILVFMGIALYCLPSFFVNAKEEVMTCDYKATYTHNGSQLSTYFKIKVIVYQDGIFKTTYDDGTSSWKELIGEEKFFNDLAYFDDNGQKGSVASVKIYNNFGLYNKSCPAIMTQNDGMNTSIQFWDPKECVNSDPVFCSQATENRQEGAPTPTVDLVKGCTQSVPTLGVEFKFNTYSDGSKQFCGRIRNTNDFTCTTEVANGLMSIEVDDPNSAYPNIYIMDPKEIFAPLIGPTLPGPSLPNFNDSLKFSCPTNIYLINTNLQEGQWKLTTSKQEADGWKDESNKLQDGSLKDNGYADSTPTAGVLHINPSGFTDITGDIDCSSIVAGEFQKWLKGLFSLIRVASIILIIVLTGMDGIKSFASFEEKNIKELYKHLITRLICLAIIFLVPSIIEFFLNIASANDNVQLVLENPWCGLFD